MSYERYETNHMTENILAVTNEELIDLATSLGVLSKYPNGETVHIDKVLKETNMKLHICHDITLKLIQ